MRNRLNTARLCTLIAASLSAACLSGCQRQLSTRVTSSVTDAQSAQAIAGLTAGNNDLYGSTQGWVLMNAAVAGGPQAAASSDGTAISPNSLATLYGTGFDPSDSISVDLRSSDGKTDYGSVPASIVAVAADGSQINLMVPDFDPAQVGALTLTVSSGAAAVLGTITNSTIGMFPAFFMADAALNLPAGTIAYYDAAGNNLHNDPITPTTTIQWDPSIAHVILELWATGALDHGCGAGNTSPLVMMSNSEGGYTPPSFIPTVNVLSIANQAAYSIDPTAATYYGPAPSIPGVQQINIDITPFLTGGAWVAYDAPQDLWLSQAIKTLWGNSPTVPTVQQQTVAPYPNPSSTQHVANPLAAPDSVMQLSLAATDCTAAAGPYYYPFAGFVNLPRVTSPLPMISCPVLNCPTLPSSNNDCVRGTDGSVISGTCCSIESVTDQAGCNLCPVEACQIALQNSG